MNEKVFQITGPLLPSHPRFRLLVSTESLKRPSTLFSYGITKTIDLTLNFYKKAIII